jgi:hypothetical protein
MEREEIEARDDEARKTAEKMEREYEQEEKEMERMEQEGLKGYNEVHPGTHTHPTSFQHQQEVYEAPGMSGDPHDVATSSERDALHNAGTTALDPEHPPSGYNNEGNAYMDRPHPLMHHEQEVHIPHNDAPSLEHNGLLNAGTQVLELEDPSLD